MRELSQIDLLASIGVLLALAMDDERDALRRSAILGRATGDLAERSGARRWLEDKLRNLDVSKLPKDPAAQPIDT